MIETAEQQTISLEAEQRITLLRARAEQWMAKRPEIVALFERFALEMAARGKPFGIGLIAERVRWEVAFSSSEHYKVNQNHRAYIARWLVRQHPELGRLMHFRKVRCP